MSDILKTKSFTAKQIPVLSFGLRELLIYSNPSIEKFLSAFFESEGKWTLEEFESEWESYQIARIQEASEGVLEGRSQEGEVKSFSRLHFPELGEKVLEAYRNTVKLVYPKEADDLLELLKARGYRIVCFSNEEESVLEYLKSFRLMDFFEFLVLGETPKPKPEGFYLIFEDLEIEAHQLIHIGADYASDVFASQAAGVGCILYDPKSVQSKRLASSDEPAEQKVVSISSLRQQRMRSDLRIIHRLQELAGIFK